MQRSRAKQGGVTLVELMVVVVVVGILASVALPTYRNQVIRSKRTEAKVALMQHAQALENCFTRFHKYSDTLNCFALTQLMASSGAPTSDGSYVVKINLPLEDLAYTLTATPQGGQAKDTECGNLTITQEGKRGVSTSTDLAKIATCWK